MAQKLSYISIRQEREQFMEYQLALQEDCENLLTKFEKLHTFEFQAFANLWIEFKFSLIYTGRYRSQELGHFTEMVFNCVKKYIIFSKSLHIQIGGLYILYGLYYKQPFKHLVKIRMLKDEFKVLKDVMKTMREKRQTDALYIFGKMLTEDAFHFTVTHYALGLELKYIPMDLKLSDNIFPINRIDLKGNFDEINRGILNDLYTTDGEYQRLLKNYLAKKNEVLEVYPLNLRSDIESILGSGEANNDPSISDNRRKIKAKSFAHISNIEKKPAVPMDKFDKDSDFSD